MIDWNGLFVSIAIVGGIGLFGTGLNYLVNATTDAYGASKGDKIALTVMFVITAIGIIGTGAF